MNWDDEPFIKVFKNDTVHWHLFKWEGQCVLQGLMRKVDRAGVIDLADGLEGLSMMLGDMPVNVIETGLARLAKYGTVIKDGSRLIIPNFLIAQTSRQSDKQRQRESRERRRFFNSLTDTDGPVTQESRNATDPSDVFGTPKSRNVTGSREIDSGIPVSGQLVTLRSELDHNRVPIRPFPIEARAILIRMREQSRDGEGICRLMLEPDEMSPPSGRLIALACKALHRHPCSTIEADGMARLIADGDAWGYVQTVSADTLFQVPDQSRKDHFGNLLGLYRTPNRKPVPLPPTHPLRELPAAAAQKARVAKRGAKPTKARRRK